MEEDNWKPLESNPESINEYLNTIGVRTDAFCFTDLYSLEDWAQEALPKPVLGIVVCFPTTKNQEELSKKKQEKALAEKNELPANFFFMKQYAHNACGTIALFHLYANLEKSHPELFEENSMIIKFKNETKDLSFDERGHKFNGNKEIKQVHKKFVEEGDSAPCDEVNNHFISFGVVDGKLFEFDGGKDLPIDLGECTPEQLLEKSCLAIKEMMNEDPENICFSMLALAKANSE